MSHEDMLGLLLGLGALAAMIGYLADVYFQPQRFWWLELPRAGGSLAKIPPPGRVREGPHHPAMAADAGGAGIRNET
ncbi:MAG: hypothetical protein NVV74_03085 [Magnetospirillum sp.]|nr:hypothetical protein [Magnetospirillum sp.]